MGVQALEGVSLEGDAQEALDAMAYELDTALRKLALSCGDVAKLQAALEQQEACVKCVCVCVLPHAPAAAATSVCVCVCERPG